MVNNEYYKCDACGTLLRLRYQVGWSHIPVSIYCPRCNCHIEGTIFINNASHDLESELFGARKADTDRNFAEYVVELSTEFIVRKCLRDSEENRFLPSMFLRSDPFDERKNRRRSALLSMSNNLLAYSNVLENIFNLLDAERIDLLKNYIATISDTFSDELKAVDFGQVENKLDAMLATKHFINVLIMPLMADGVFNRIYDIMNVKMKRIVGQRTDALKEFLKYIGGDYIDIYLSRIPSFIADYMKIAGQLIPVYGNYIDFDSIDLSTYGISTMSIDDLSVIYKKGFEIICDSIDLLIALRNIEDHGSFDNFGKKNLCDFNEKMRGFASKYKKYEYATNNESDLFDGIRGVLDNTIRNAEGHNAIEIDGLNQKAVFKNKNRGEIVKCELSFLEFGKKCIDVFSAVLYIWEYYYQLAKLKSIYIDGATLNYGTYDLKTSK